MNILYIVLGLISLVQQCGSLRLALRQPTRLGRERRPSATSTGSVRSSHMFDIEYDYLDAIENDEEEDDFAHDEITYRVRSGDVQHIPQAERYSTKDWLHNLRTLPTSRLLRRIRQVVFWNFIWSTFVYVMYSTVPIKFESPGARAHSLLGSALGLLLVFRTNTAYNRFWEGRKIWEQVLTTIRAMARWVIMFSEVYVPASTNSSSFVLVFTQFSSFPPI
jgi:hypothetical protein